MDRQHHRPINPATLLTNVDHIATLAAAELSDGRIEASFDRLGRIAGKLLGLSTAFVSLADIGDQDFGKIIGLPDAWTMGLETTLSHELSQRIVTSGKPLAIDDTRLSDAVNRDAGIIAYLGVPLAIGDQVFGSFCAIDDKPRAWTADDEATLNDLAHSIVGKILLRLEHRSALAIQARLRTTLSSIGDGVITTDTGGNVSFLNPVAEQLTGWSNAEAIGLPMGSIFHIVNETTRLPVQNPVEKVLEHGGIVGLANHTTLIARDGTERAIDDSAAPIKLPDGSLVGCIMVFRDITERRDQEIQLDQTRIYLESMLAAGNVGTWTWDLASDDVIVDEYLARMLGFAPEQSRRGPLQAFLDRIHPDDHAAIRQKVREAIEATDQYDAEYRVVRSDGETRWVTARGRVRRDEDGKAIQLPGVVIDITEQKRLQDQLRDTKTQLDQLLSAGSVATWTWDVVADRLIADDNLARLFNVSPEEAKGGSLAAYTRAIHPDDRDRVGRAIADSVAAGSHYDAEYRVLTPSGGIRWLNARGVIHRDARGKATTFDGVVIETTDRRLAEQAIREKETFQRLIFESVRDFSIFTTDLTGIITSWNAGAENVFGYAEAEAIGQPAALIFTPEDRAEGVPQRELSTAAQTGRASDERWHLRKDGSRFFASGYVRPVNDDSGSLIGFAKVARDTTESRQAQLRLQESEERFRVLFESMDEGYCVIQLRYDANGRADDYRFLITNPAFGTIVRIDNPTGKWASEALPGLDRTWHEIYARIDRTGEPERFEMGEQILEGRTFSIYAFRVGDPAEHKVAVLFNDITHRIRNLAERERLVDQLTEADRRKDEFLAMLAHELRNPLGAISAGVQLVQTVKKPEVLAELRDMIQHQVKHLTHLIDDLLDVSRITQGKVELRPQTVELNTITRKAAELAQPQIDEKRHELSVSTPAKSVLFVADPTRVEQMLSNLLTNAAKYSEPGRAIDLSARVEGGEVVFRIRDQGFGITAEMLPKVFGLFTQVDATLDRSRGGLGIGLTLVKNLAELHGGSVSAASEGTDKGSEFTLRLPIGDPEPLMTTVDAPTVPTPKRLPTPKHRVLIIDDNRDTAKMTSRLLAFRGYEMQMAFDGFEGIEAARAFNPDVILLDIGLPGMNGYDVARQLRTEECCKDSVIVAVSGYGEATARDRSHDAGFDHHLTKPVDFEQLDAILAALTSPG